jgi:hypothetical protein
MEFLEEVSKDELFVRVKLSTKEAADCRDYGADSPGSGTDPRDRRIDSVSDVSNIHSRGGSGFAGD